MMKGQMTTELVAIEVIMISSGLIFSAILGYHTLSSETEYWLNGPEVAAEAKIQEDLYERRLTKELNYSLNWAGVRLADIGAGAGWEDDINPQARKQEIKSAYLSWTLDKLRTQNREVGNCQPPAINSVNHEGDPRTGTYSVEFSEEFMVCGSSFSEAGIPVDQSNYETINPRNRFLPIAYFAVELANKAEEVIDQNVDENSANAVATDDCSVSMQQLRDRAEEDAKEEVVGSNFEIGQEAYQSISDQEPQNLDVEFSTSYEESFEEVNSHSRCGNNNDERLYETEYTLSEIRVNFQLTEDMSNPRILGPFGDEVKKKIDFRFTYSQSF